MNRRRFRTGLLALSLTAAAAAVAAPGADARGQRVEPEVLGKIAYFRRQTWRWQELMGYRRTPSSGAAWRRESTPFRRWVLRGWRRKAARLWIAANAIPNREAWLCIHSGEGSWDANTGNGYYGGLQMDLGFQRTYAPAFLLRKGTADRWTALEQMWVAERARRSGRGYYPWPNTARACGLI